ncbi:MAG: CHRD domain-containing protein [Owenweeksia sp.]
MKKLYALAVAFLAATTLSTAAHLSGNLLFTAKMTGGQEVPAVSTNALGVATFFLNEDMDSLCINATAANLSGPITGIHIHTGARGVNGAVLIDLTPEVRGNRIISTLTGSNLTSTLIKAMIEGSLYLNVHTAANSNGEIRGQIELETDFSYHASLDGGQEVPAVSTSAQGLATFALSKTTQQMDVEVVVDDLSGPITGAHLHKAAMGSNGPVIQDLTPFVNNNRISGSFDPTAILGALDSGNIYLNVHTMANPNGEIRGQLKIKRGILYFDAVLDTAQEDIAVTAAGNPTGVAWFNINAGLDTIEYDILVEDVTATATGVHLHTGPVGGAGPVQIDLSANINGNRIKGFYTGSNLDADFIHDILSGGVYVNVHTTANPNGELRGQAYRLAREGYSARLDGFQEVPGVNTMASGSGMVSIDRNQSNAHFMVVVSGLSGVVTGAHFHVAQAGASGPVIYNLTPYFSGGGASDGAFGYWTGNDPNTPFVIQNSVQFRGDSVYYNIHTAANPNGEIRGQVLRGSECFVNNISREEELKLESLSIYPNPLIGNELTIGLESQVREVSIRIHDMNGREVYRKHVTGTREFTLKPSLSKGVYLVKVQTENGVRTMKLIQQ